MEKSSLKLVVGAALFNLHLNMMTAKHTLGGKIITLDLRKLENKQLSFSLKQNSYQVLNHVETTNTNNIF
jgi:hypothetical protein